VNKPVLEFDEFMKIPVHMMISHHFSSYWNTYLHHDGKGCTKGTHTTDALPVDAPKSTSSVNLKVTETPAGKEIYTLGSGPSNSQTPTAPVATAPPQPIIEEEDDPNIPVEAGTMCRRKGCGVVFKSDGVNRIEGAEGAVCIYHPAPVSITRINLQYHF
jgi:hypothetical protein